MRGRPRTCHSTRCRPELRQPLGEKKAAPAKHVVGWGWRGQRARATHAPSDPSDRRAAPFCPAAGAGILIAAVTLASAPLTVTARVHANSEFKAGSS
eukprot:11706156-Alexandrium_andersonii.AAC.1